MRSAPQGRLDIQPGECAGFPITLPAQPEHLAHAYVAYTASGVRRSFALQRRINGGLTHGGAWMAATGVHAVVDEIDPRSLRRGVNDLTLCVPAEAAGPVTVDQARLLGRVDTGRELVTQLRLDGKEAELAPVRDGDLATSVQVAGGQRLTIDLPRWIAPDAVVLAGSVEAVNASCLDREGVGHDLASVLQGDVLVLEGGGARCASLALTFERDAVIAELDVLGSGAAEPVDWPHLVLTSTAERFGDVAWISGFVARPRSMSTAIRVRVGADEVPSRTGEFGLLVRRASGETTRVRIFCDGEQSRDSKNLDRTRGLRRRPDGNSISSNVPDGARSHRPVRAFLVEPRLRIADAAERPPCARRRRGPRRR